MKSNTLHPDIELVDVDCNEDKEFDLRYGYQRPEDKKVLLANRELVSNCLDNGATRITIILDKERQIYRIINNGRGFQAKDRKGFFWLGKSYKTGTGGQIGQHGTGRTKALRFLKKMVVYTVSQDAPRGASTELNREMLKNIFLRKIKQAQWQLGIRLPSWWKEYFAEGTTGSAIDLHIDEQDWKLLPDPKYFIEELSRHLLISQAEKIRVGNAPLKQRELLVPTIIRKTFGEEEMGKEMFKALGGTGEVELYIPKDPKPDEIVLLGGEQPICEITDFIRGVANPKQTGLIPELFRNGTVLGVVPFPILNQHCAESRDALNDSVYKTGLYKHIIDFLSNVLGPIVEKTFGKTREDLQRAREDQFLNRWSKDVHKATGFDPTSVDIGTEPGGCKQLPSGTKKVKVRPENESPIVLNREWMTVCIGEPEDLRATQHINIKPEDLDWLACKPGTDASNIRPEDQETGIVTLSQVSGADTTMTPLRTGKCTIICRNRRKPAEFDQVLITVLASRQLLISPSKTTIPQGGSQVFRARNYDGTTSGKLKWNTPRKRGITLRNTNGLLTTIETSDDCPVGEYTLNAVDENDADITAQAVFEVKPNRRQSPLVQIDNRIYKLVPAGEQPKVLMISQEGVWPQKPGQPALGKASVYFGHSELASLRTEEARYLYLFSQLALQHLLAEEKQGNIEGVRDLNEKLSEIVGTYLKGRHKKK